MDYPLVRECGEVLPRDIAKHLCGYSLIKQMGVFVLLEDLLDSFFILSAQMLEFGYEGFVEVVEVSCDL